MSVGPSNAGGGESLGGNCLSPEDLLSYLEGRTRRGDSQAVQRHLDLCASCCVVMAEAARATTPASPCGDDLRTLGDGEEVGGRYQIRRFIARGGMGEVYEAFDVALSETVALKTLLLTTVDQSDAIERLLAEVRIARRVTHPRVCRILEFGVHRRARSPGEPIPFLTMPLLQGETLAQRLERDGPLSTAAAWPILRDLVAGLGAVHEAGVVHRDFKSENAFLVRDPEGVERAVVMDFGLARAAGLQIGLRRSSGKLVLGTLAYMAPEQVEGKTVTQAADVYALGAVAFEMLTGRVPFAGESPTSVALARLSQAAPAPSSLVPALGADWDLLIGRCLKREPGDRFADMPELAGALEAMRTRTGGRRPSPWLAVSLTVALVTALAIAIVTVSAGVTTRARSAPPAEITTATVGRTVVAPPPAVLVLDPPAAQEPPPPIIQGQPRRAPRLPAVHRPRSTAAAPEAASPPVARPALSSDPMLVRPTQSRPRHADDLINPF